MKKFLNPRTTVLAVLIVFAGVWRLFMTSGYTPLTNFTPVGAMALFGGYYFSDRWKAFLFPLLTLWISDLFLSYFVYAHQWQWFYNGSFIIYGSFALMTLMGSWIKKVNVKNIILLGVSAALMHWLVTDFGVWISGNMYPKTFDGLLACYIAAIPFMKNMLIGNLIFSGIMFGVFEWAQKKYPSLQMQHA